MTTKLTWVCPDERVPHGVPWTVAVSGQGLEEDAEKSEPEEEQAGVEDQVEDGDLQPGERGPAEDGSLLRIVEEELESLPSLPVPTGGLDGRGTHDVHLLHHLLLPGAGAWVFLDCPLLAHLGVLETDGSNPIDAMQ